MTEIDLLKRVRDDVPDPDPYVLARTRHLLTAPEPANPRRIVRRRVLVAGGLALTLAGGFLIADVVTRDHAAPLGATADAGTFLNDAAARIGSNPDTPIPPGHFRQITVQSSMIDTFTSNPDLRATIFSRGDKWIPAKPTARYVQQGTKLVRVEFPSAAARTAARKLAPELFATPGRTTTGYAICSDPVGPLNQSTTRCEAGWTTPTPGFLAKLPRDPDALLAALRQDTTGVGHPSPPDFRAFLHLSSVLGSGLVPADLRAALYRAAAKIPGIELLNDVVTLDGHHGRAIGIVGQDVRKEIVVAPANGAFLGGRDVVVPGHHGPGLRTGDIVSSYAVSTRIAATQPAVK
ncbi:CU044_5270 family protein [Kribbella sp. NPDC059898]|uniref:CU044_5270 family protein n=1 Tax=Kribbella sp. NPDC059898 TaxID=3346995 RepID=UPI003651D87A